MQAGVFFLCNTRLCCLGHNCTLFVVSAQARESRITLATEMRPENAFNRYRVHGWSAHPGVPSCYAMEAQGYSKVQALSLKTMTLVGTER